MCNIRCVADVSFPPAENELNGMSAKELEKEKFNTARMCIELKQKRHVRDAASLCSLLSLLCAVSCPAVSRCVLCGRTWCPSWASCWTSPRVWSKTWSTRSCRSGSSGSRSPASAARPTPAWTSCRTGEAAEFKYHLQALLLYIIWFTIIYCSESVFLKSYFWFLFIYFNYFYSKSDFLLLLFSCQILFQILLCIYLFINLVFFNIKCDFQLLVLLFSEYLFLSDLISDFLNNIFIKLFVFLFYFIWNLIFIH